MSVLASGSTGNATYVESEKGSLLVDVGLTGKKMEELFSQIDRNIKDLNGILVTHEHIDHIKGLGVLARKYNLQYTRMRTRGKPLKRKIVVSPWIRSSYSIHMKRNLLQVLISSLSTFHMTQSTHNSISLTTTIRNSRC